MKLKTLFLVIIAMFITNSDYLLAQTKTNGKKILIVYYSLHNGNTRIVAEEIRKNIGGDVFRIETVKPYPVEYNDVTAQAKRELQSGFRPELKTKVANMEQYDVIFLGSPSWWNTIGMPVMSFLESYDFTGKTMIPFITHEGSRMGDSVEDIKKLAPKATVLKGLSVRGGSVNNCSEEVKSWLKEVGMLK